MRALRALTLALLLVAVGACGSNEVVLVPGDVAAGRVVYEAACAGCHGVFGAGTGQGPPVVDPLYAEPGYTDRQMARAIREGVRRQHWDFGAMPGLRSLSDREISDVVAYVRELQGP